VLIGSAPVAHPGIRAKKTLTQTSTVRLAASSSRAAHVRTHGRRLRRDWLSQGFGFSAT
jgi:hypothetical protein